MNNNQLKQVKKMLKKENEVVIVGCPTLEQCDKLYEEGISVTKKTSLRNGLYNSYNVDYCKYCYND